MLDTAAPQLNLSGDLSLLKPLAVSASAAHAMFYIYVIYLLQTYYTTTLDKFSPIDTMFYFCASVPAL